MMAAQESDEIFVVDTLEEKHLLGVIHNSDISSKSLEQNVAPESLYAEFFIKKLPFTAKETTTLEECQRLLEAGHLEHLAVVDEKGHLCGVYERVNHLKTLVLKVGDEDEAAEEKMESEGGHDSHTVH